MKPKQLTGQGRPPDDLKAPLGQKYRDLIRNDLWIKTKHGWELATFLHIEPLWLEKYKWGTTAKSQGMRLEDWVIKALNDAAMEK